MKMVHITWDDAAIIHDDADWRWLAKQTLSHLETVGFLIDEDESRYILTQEISPKDEDGRHTIIIPKVNVVSIQYLAPEGAP